MIQQMRINPRSLGRNVSSDAKRAPGQLVNELEGPEVQILARTGQQRIEILQHRRHHKLESTQAEMIEQRTSQGFNTRRFQRQCVSDVFR